MWDTHLLHLLVLLFRTPLHQWLLLLLPSPTRRRPPRTTGTSCPQLPTYGIARYSSRRVLQQPIPVPVDFLVSSTASCSSRTLLEMRSYARVSSPPASRHLSLWCTHLLLIVWRSTIGLWQPFIATVIRHAFGGLRQVPSLRSSNGQVMSVFSASANNRVFKIA
jgi:hypothetical protein